MISSEPCDFMYGTFVAIVAVKMVDNIIISIHPLQRQHQRSLLISPYHCLL